MIESLALQAARYYLTQGFAPIPIPARSKAPVLAGWQNLRLTESDLPRYFANGANVGILNGEPSHGANDVDLDAAEAMITADYLLSATDQIHGRFSKPRSHRWFVCDPVPDTEKFADIDGTMLVELRSTGSQTVVPPSVHPSGETIAPDPGGSGQAAHIDGRILRAEVAAVAAAALIARHWPEKGGRHRAALALCGVLTRHSRWDGEGVADFVRAVCAAAGDTETHDRVRGIVYTEKRIESGKPATGIPTLIDLIGKPVVDRALDWLGIEAARTGTDPEAAHAKSKVPTDDELRNRWLLEHPDTRYGMGEWRRYQDGIWPVVPDLMVKDEMAQICEEAKGEGIKPTARLVGSVCELARMRVAIPDERWDADPDVLVCRNGALHVPTMELRPHRAEDYATSRVPYDYSPGTLAPTWAWFLTQTIPDVADFLQEFAGYCLTTDTSLEIAVWLHGPPGSGKSTFIVGLQAMLGQRAMVLGLADIERSRFALANLPGKTLAVATEQPSTYVESGHVLNAMISGEPMPVERKFKDPYLVTPRVKLCWAMNDLPRVGNASSGLFRRVKVVSFSPLAREDRDPKVKELIKAEGAGILNWAISGLVRLRARGRFLVPQTVEDATSHFAETNDIPALFVAECCQVWPDGRTQAQVLYQRYRAWCEGNGHKPLSSTKLAEEWTRLGFERSHINGRIYWNGVSIPGTAPL